MEVFRNSELKESVIPKNEKNSNPSKNIFFYIFGVISLLIIISIILIIIISLNSSKNKNNDNISIIKCIYNIDDISKEILLLNEDYTNINNSILNIYINETEIKFNKKYKFNNKGIYEIKFILNKEIILDNIFKDIQYIQKIEMYSNSSNKIISMQNSFEENLNLNYLSISGFNTEQLK